MNVVVVHVMPMPTALTQLVVLTVCAMKAIAVMDFIAKVSVSVGVSNI